MVWGCISASSAWDLANTGPVLQIPIPALICLTYAGLSSLKNTYEMNNHQFSHSEHILMATISL